MKRGYPPPPPRTGEEYFHFLDLAFNVTYALESVIGLRRPDGYVQAVTLLPKVVIRESHMGSERVQRLDPVIIATLPPPFGLVSIDGHHRAAHAYRTGRLWLTCHVLDEEETRACCYTRGELLRLKREAAYQRDQEVLASVMGCNIQIFTTPHTYKEMHK